MTGAHQAGRYARDIVEVITVGDAERTRFDAAVAASPFGDVMQSYAWGEVKGAGGWDALRLLVTDGDAVRGACLVLRRRVAQGVPPLLYAPRGPIFADEQALGTLLDGIRARAGAAMLFKCDPPVEVDSPEATALERAGLRRVHAGPFGGTQPTAVMVLDLTPGADKVFEGFKSKWRYNVRLAERKGVSIRAGSAADLPAFHAVYRATETRQGFAGRALSYFEHLYRVLEPAGMLRLFLAEHDGGTLGAIICMPFGERVLYVYGGSSDHKRNLMPNHLLQWHAIRWACEQGYKVYDFRGVSPVRDGEPVEPELAGLNRFKEGFGARTVEYAGEFDLPLRRAWYGLWRVGLPLAMRARRTLHGAAPQGD